MQQTQSELILKVKAEYKNLSLQFNHLLEIPASERDNLLVEFRNLAIESDTPIYMLSLFDNHGNYEDFFKLFQMTVSELSKFFDQYLMSELEKNFKNDTTETKDRLRAAFEFTQSYIIQYQTNHPALFHKLSSNQNYETNITSHKYLTISPKEQKRIISEVNNLKKLIEIDLKENIESVRALFFFQPENYSEFFGLFRMSETKMYEKLNNYLEQDLIGISHIFSDSYPREIQEEVLIITAMFKTYIKEYWHKIDNTAQKTIQPSVANNPYSFSSNNEEDEATYVRDFFHQLQL